MKVLLSLLCLMSISCSSKAKLNANVAEQGTPVTNRTPATSSSEGILELYDSPHATLREDPAAILFDILTVNSNVVTKVENGVRESIVVAKTAKGSVACKKAVLCMSGRKSILPTRPGGPDVTDDCMQYYAKYTCYLQRPNLKLVPVPVDEIANLRKLMVQ